jgi:hypothetical protein
MADNVAKTYADSPDRCQTVLAEHQCNGKAIPGSRYCAMHGGNKALEGARKEEHRNYNLAKWRDKVGQKAESESLLSLKEEIGILRMMLEERLNMCNDVQDLLMNSSQITTFIEKIERLVGTLFKIDNYLGERIGKDKLIVFADSVVGMLIKFVTPEVLQAVQSELERAIKTLSSDGPQT